MKYIANPVEVDAFEIIGVAEPNADCTVNLELDNGAIEIATISMMSRMKPQMGDYWVIQSDGYVYLNPKDVFERKYRAAVSTATEHAAPK